MDQAASVEAREADCTSAADLAVLARQAHALDAELAKDLPGKAAAQRQVPADHLAAAALDPAEALHGDHFVFAEPARVAASLGLGGKIAPLLAKGAGQCTSAAPDRQLADRLLVTGCDWDEGTGARRGPAASVPGCARTARLGRWSARRLPRPPVGARGLPIAPSTRRSADGRRAAPAGAGRFPSVIAAAPARECGDGAPKFEDVQGPPTDGSRGLR